MIWLVPALLIVSSVIYKHHIKDEPQPIPTCKGSELITCIPGPNGPDNGYPAMSWDQENLKRHDRGCPTAIYIAPNGVLEQC